mgnify:CR=1 FL=1
MIIDSHAHYTRRSFENTFRYQDEMDGVFEISEGGLKDIFEKMEESYLPLVKQLCITPDTIKEVVRDIHVKCFNNKPIL